MVVVRSASSRPQDPVVVTTNSDEDCSPAAFAASLERLLRRPETDLDSIEAARALSELRVDSGS